MSQPVKISDELILDARLTAEIAERLIAGQIEFWAQLGRAIEPLLEGSRALALRRAGATGPLSESLTSVDSAAGRRRVLEYLESRPFPHYISQFPARLACWSGSMAMAREPLADSSVGNSWLSHAPDGIPGA